MHSRRFTLVVVAACVIVSSAHAGITSAAGSFFGVVDAIGLNIGKGLWVNQRDGIGNEINKTDWMATLELYSDRLAKIAAIYLYWASSSVHNAVQVVNANTESGRVMLRLGGGHRMEKLGNRTLCVSGLKALCQYSMES